MVPYPHPGAGAVPEGADDGQAQAPSPERLLRPLGGMSKDPEWRQFAEIISRVWHFAHDVCFR